MMPKMAERQGSYLDLAKAKPGNSKVSEFSFALFSTILPTKGKCLLQWTASTANELQKGMQFSEPLLKVLIFFLFKVEKRTPTPTPAADKWQLADKKFVREKMNKGNFNWYVSGLIRS